MQLILRQKTTDPAAWESAFASDRENQANAGLNLLQLWIDASDKGTRWALFEVSDRDQAQSWVDTVQSGLLDKRAAVTSSEFHFVETA
ncbi:DUF3303 family protein [Oceaniglobus trochenteri]|uniref:DUF3303 family protein n=1 Tax=Oceaniglobus trochenteri TaxID=2763260 RepID=UPI001CFF685E|nr:DUF3303 family protein [Oceaniglobus trochenteri]